MSVTKNIVELVSVIMPAYNCDRYIEEAIYSVINQTYQSWELIVIDDCSKDKTAHIIEKLLKVDARIRYYKNDNNNGVSATRNRGIALANGAWIAFLDSDDRWDRMKLEKQMMIAVNKNIEFLFTGSSYINENGDFYKGVFNVPEIVTFKKLRKHNVISCSSVLINKRFFNHIKMEKDEMHEDYAVWLKILKGGVCAYGINEPLLTYRISKNSKSGNKLKTIKMTYKVYRFLNINPLSSAFFTVSHVILSLKKYKKIFFNPEKYN
jgi:teichuronic acid biosynthesis glycosyltransferase TuaG